MCSLIVFNIQQTGWKRENFCFALVRLISHVASQIYLLLSGTLVTWLGAVRMVSNSNVPINYEKYEIAFIPILVHLYLGYPMITVTIAIYFHLHDHSCTSQNPQIWTQLIRNQMSQHMANIQSNPSSMSSDMMLIII